MRDDGIGGTDQDRVEALGGTIAIDSSAGNGTRVVATFPLPAETAEE